MFGIGAQELILILVVALLVFGPKRLPDLARSLGRGLAEFRRASSDLRHSLSQEPSAEPPSRPSPGERIAKAAEPTEPAQAGAPDRHREPSAPAESATAPAEPAAAATSETPPDRPAKPAEPAGG